MDLIKTALVVSNESIKTDPAAETIDARGTTPAAAAKVEADRNEHERAQDPAAALDKKGVVMTGPLGLVFTRALNISYAKPDPATGEFTTAADTSAPVGVAQGQGEAVTMEEFACALESQANDWLMAAAALREKQARLVAAGAPMEDGDDDDTNSVPLTTSGTRSVSVTPEEVIAIFSEPENLPNGSNGAVCDFIFYTDATAPSSHSPAGPGGYGSYNSGEKMLYMGDGWRTSIESISIVVKTRTDKQ